MTADAGEFDRVLWQGASSTSRGLGSRLRPVALPVVIALVVVGGILFITGTSDRPGAWLLAAVFTVPVVYTAGRKVLETMQPQRYTLTERRFVVESNEGRHAYDLLQLGNLKVEAHDDGTGDIGYRRPREPTPPTPTVAYDEDAMAWSFRRHLLAHDVLDAETVAGRITTARRDLAGAEPMPDAAAPPPADASAPGAHPKPELRSLARRPSLFMAVAAIVIGLVPIALVVTGAAEEGSEFFALLSGGVFIGAGTLMLTQRFIGLTRAPPSTPSAGVPRLLEPWVADIHPGLGLFFAFTGLGIVIVDVWAGGPTILSLLPAALVVGGLILAFQSMRGRVRIRQLRRQGAPTRGTIVGHLRGRRGGVAIYRYRLPDGREETGRTRHLPFRELERWGLGDEIDVRYDPANPPDSAAFDAA